MARRVVVWIALLAGAALAPAQDDLRPPGPGTLGAAALRHAIRDVASDHVVMVVASHPDDRWTLPAAVLRFGLGHEVHVVLATRGEGGQNRVGSEIGDALGRIRTLEALRSAARLDVQLSFLDLPDLGYCRTAAEALEQWGAARTLDRLTAAIRRLEPQAVIIPHYRGEEHGHDLALLDALPEAVQRVWPDADAPGRPRLFRPIAPDQPVRDALGFGVDLVDPAVGKTFLELAYDVLVEEHASQRPLPAMREHFRSMLRRGGTEGSTLFLEAFGDRRPVPSRLCEGHPDLFALLAAGGRMDPAAVLDLRQQFEAGIEQDLGSLPRLVQRAARLDRVLEQLEEGAEPALGRALASRRRALAAILCAAVGLRVLPDFAAEAVAVPGEELILRIHLHNGDVAGVRKVRIRAARGGQLRLADGVPGLAAELVRRATAVLGGAFTVAPDLLQDAAALAPRMAWPLALEVRFEVHGRELSMEVPLAVPTRPAVELGIAPPKLLITPGLDGRDLMFSVTVRRNSNFPVRGRLLVNAPPGIRARTRFGQDSMVFLDVGRVQSVPYRLRLPEGYDSPVSLLQARFGDRALKIPLQMVDANVPRDLHVGLVQGVDNAARDVLLGLGVKVTPLEDVDLTTRDLSGFDTILIDIRALAVREGARAAMGILLRFAAQPGKRLVVLYHKDSEFNPETSGIEGAPFQPFRIGKGRVTEPDAAVRVLDPDHPLLRIPNRIRAEDWDGWIQERGLYFAADYDLEHYTPLLAMADEGRPEERGALLHCRTGGGEYVYCGLALFRQLNISHPGAIRLLLNLVTPAPPG